MSVANGGDSSLHGPKHWLCVGILGGGQLGRMMAEEARRLNIRTHILDPQQRSPAAQVGDLQVVGNFNHSETVHQFVDHVADVDGQQVGIDVLTMEIEHVDVKALAAFEQTSKIPIRPSAATIALIQDKYQQKVHMSKHNIALGPFTIIESIADIHTAAAKFGLPLMLKSRLNAYDGKGNAVLHTLDEIDAALKSLGQDSTSNKLMLYAEKMIDFTQELAVMVARSVSGECRSYVCVTTTQRDNICHTVIAPAQVPSAIAKQAEQLAVKAIESLTGAGIYGVEMFLCRDNTLLLNEIAPRPHNSGHFTIEACETSQFQQHLRCVAGLPLGSTAMCVGGAVMINLLGTGDSPLDAELSWLPCQAAMHIPGAHVHWYGKAGVRKGRKLGHINITGTSVNDALNRMQQWEAKTEQLKADLPGALASKYLNQSSRPRALPLVGVIMGSDSDLKHMKAACEILTAFNVPFECTIVSAHRTPERMLHYAKGAHARGMRVIIAGAGGAAHLPGMVAALTCLPVVGVPIALTHLDGVDSLHSIVQMPRGVPCATVAINNSTNAGLLAVRMLSIGNPDLAARMEEYQVKMEQEVNAKIEKMENIGWANYTA